MNNTFDAVIFDLDGTLIDSMWAWDKIDEIYLGQFGVKADEFSEEEVEGMSFTETAQYMKTRFNIEDDVEKIKKDINQIAFEFYKSQVPLKEGVREFLDYLDGQGIKMGIATSNSYELINVILEVHHIKNKFGAICTSCEVEKGKPYPYVYEKVAKDLGVEPKRCLTFEDVPNGVLAAKRAGMTSCAIRDRQDEEMEERLRQEAHYFVEDYREIIAYYENKKQETYA